MAGLDVVRNYIPLDRLPRAVYEIQLDWVILTFTFGLSFICGLVSGVAPAIQISRAQPIDVLRESSRSATAGAERQRLRSAFVVGQVAIAFVLLIGAGVSLNTMLTNLNTPIGFHPKGQVTVQMELPDARFRVPTGSILESGAQAVDAEPAGLFIAEQIRRSLATLEGVSSVSAIAIWKRKQLRWLNSSRSCPTTSGHWTSRLFRVASLVQKIRLQVHLLP
jgi:hypothetical protein